MTGPADDPSGGPSAEGGTPSAPGSTGPSGDVDRDRALDELSELATAGEPGFRIDGPPAGRSAIATLALGFGIGLAVIALVAGVGVATGLFGRSTLRPLPAPIRSAVVLVPIGQFPSDRAVAIRDRLAGDYGLPISVAPAVPIDAASADASRGQLVSERLVNQLGFAHPEWRNGTLVIGLTDADVYIAGRPSWQFAFGYRTGDGIAVISSARMTRAIDLGDARWRRLQKMVTRDVAFLYYGLKATSDPTDLLYDSILGLSDLDRIGDRL